MGLAFLVWEVVSVKTGRMHGLVSIHVLAGRTAAYVVFSYTDTNAGKQSHSLQRKPARYHESHTY